MQEPKETIDVWSLYWAENRLHSCVASDGEIDQKVLNKLWSDLAESLPQEAQVLDLATGNGAVPAALLSANPSLKITAVDKADIKPKEFLKDRPELDGVDFIGSIDVSEPVLGDSQFDALTSQFGIEYAGLVGSALANLSKLKPGASFQFLVHHNQSEIVRSSQPKVVELGELLAADAVLPSLLRVVKGELAFSELEQVGQTHLQGQSPRTQSITGQVFAGIEQVAKLLASDLATAQQLAVTLNLRVSSEHQRLQQLLQAAQTEEQLQSFTTELTSTGITSVEYTEVYMNEENHEYLLGWLITGRKATSS